MEHEGLQSNCKRVSMPPKGSDNDDCNATASRAKVASASVKASTREHPNATINSAKTRHSIGCKKNQEQTNESTGLETSRAPPARHWNPTNLRSGQFNYMPQDPQEETCNYLTTIRFYGFGIGSAPSLPGPGMKPPLPKDTNDAVRNLWRR